MWVCTICFIFSIFGYIGLALSIGLALYVNKGKYARVFVP